MPSFISTTLISLSANNRSWSSISRVIRCSIGGSGTSNLRSSGPDGDPGTEVSVTCGRLDFLGPGELELATERGDTAKFRVIPLFLVELERETRGLPEELGG